MVLFNEVGEDERHGDLAFEQAVRQDHLSTLIYRFVDELNHFLQVEDPQLSEIYTMRIFSYQQPGVFESCNLKIVKLLWVQIWGVATVNDVRDSCIALIHSSGHAQQRSLDLQFVPCSNLRRLRS